MSDSIMIMDKNGKITIPKNIRQENNFSEGSKFAILKTEDGFLLIPFMTKEEFEAKLINVNDLQRVMEEGQRQDLDIEK